MLFSKVDELHSCRRPSAGFGSSGSQLTLYFTPTSVRSLRETVFNSTQVLYIWVLKSESSSWSQCQVFKHKILINTLSEVVTERFPLCPASWAFVRCTQRNEAEKDFLLATRWLLRYPREICMPEVGYSEQLRKQWTIQVKRNISSNTSWHLKLKTLTLLWPRLFGQSPVTQKVQLQ